MSAYRIPAVQVFPGGAVPANLLRWHLFFDRPVDALAGQSAVTLLDGSGHEVPHAFVELPEGLWDEAGRRMTLLVHPGRIKGGLQSQELLGSVLQRGQRASLRIDLDRLLERGAGAMEHKFFVDEANDQAIDLAHWRFGLVQVGSLQPLAIEFDRSMDRASLEGALAVVSADGGVLDGFMTYALDGCAMAFVPRRPWRAGSHCLRVADDLEDVAGNRLGVAFQATAGRTASEVASWAFTVWSLDGVPR